MALLTRDDLMYDYSWDEYEVNDSKISGEPGSSVLNRSEGNEVLYFINKLVELWGKHNKDDGLRLERMIQEEVPDSVRSQIDIMDWISKKWLR